MKKYAVIRTVGDMETVVRKFTDKTPALVFGTEYAKNNTNVVVSVEYADFDDDGNLQGGNRKIIEVWKRQ